MHKISKNESIMEIKRVWNLYMVDLKLLEGLSVSAAIQFLHESRYIEKEVIKQESLECDIILIYPYVLYGDNGNVLDRIGHAEYCMIDEDGEPDDYKSCWLRF